MAANIGIVSYLLPNTIDENQLFEGALVRADLVDQCLEDLFQRLVSIPLIQKTYPEITATILQYHLNDPVEGFDEEEGLEEHPCKDLLDEMSAYEGLADEGMECRIFLATLEDLTAAQLQTLVQAAQEFVCLHGDLSGSLAEILVQVEVRASAAQASPIMKDISDYDPCLLNVPQKTLQVAVTLLMALDEDDVIPPDFIPKWKEAWKSSKRIRDTFGSAQALGPALEAINHCLGWIPNSERLKALKVMSTESLETAEFFKGLLDTKVREVTSADVPPAFGFGEQ